MPAPINYSKLFNHSGAGSPAPQIGHTILPPVFNYCSFSRGKGLTDPDWHAREITQFEIKEVEVCEAERIVCASGNADGCGKRRQRGTGERLLQQGADVNEPSVGYSSPLQAAAGGGHLEMVTFLLKNGANPNRPKDALQSALDSALQKGHLAIVKCLLDAGTKLDGENDALEYAVIGGQSEALELLLKRDAPKINAASALRKAAQLGYFSCARILVDAGVDAEKDPIYSVDLFGDKLAKPETPFVVATRAKHKHIVNLLSGKKVDTKAALADEQKALARRGKLRPAPWSRAKGQIAAQ